MHTADRKACILLYDQQAPRYTSYPTAPHFQAGFNEDIYRDWLQDLPAEQPIGLYIHIPFCHQLCFYCGCSTAVTRRPERVQTYLSLLRQEIELIAAALPGLMTVRHLHFGGGSPTLLTAEDFTALMQFLRASFSFSAEASIALEADPRQLSEEKIAAYTTQGVNRLSLGVQDFDQRVLQAVNRPQPAILTELSLAWCRSHGLDNVNLDLIYGLPHQSAAGICDTMTKIAALGAPRLAFFGYAHVPWLKKHMQAIDENLLPDAAGRYDLWTSGSAALCRAGYLPIGIDHFVRPGDALHQALQNRTLRRNFQGYTADSPVPLLGLGPSAIGTLPQGFAQNTADMELYETRLRQNRLPTHRGLPVTAQDHAHGALIEEIMCYLEVDLAQHPQVSSAAMAIALQRLRPLIDDGLLTQDGTKLRLAPDARMLARIFAAAFDSYRADAGVKPARHSRVI